MVNTTVKLCGVMLDNPVIAASGCFGYGREFSKIYDVNILGSFSFKGTTLHPRFGNSGVRIAECDSGMLNCVGLQNPGLDAVINRELPEIGTFFRKPVMANISGFSTAEYVECAERLSAQAQVGWIELNISCPNVHDGGMSFGTSPESAAEVTRAVRRVCKKPLIVKLTPNVTDIAEIARAVEGAGADGVSLINTLMGMRIDLRMRRPLLGNTTGGLSGPSVFPVALRCVWQVYEAVSIPVVGMGGVSSARDVIEMMLAGARAVEVGAANLVNPFACKDIIEALPEEMSRLRITNLADITGGAH